MDLQQLIEDKLAVEREKKILSRENAAASLVSVKRIEYAAERAKEERSAEGTLPETSLAEMSLDARPSMGKLMGKKRKRDNAGSNLPNDIDEEEQPKSFAPGKKPPRSKTKAVYKEYKVVNTRTKDRSDELAGNRHEPSDWYQSLNTNNPKLSRGDLQKLLYVKDIIKKCIAAPTNAEREKFFGELRVYIHEMDCSPKFAFLKDSEALVRKSKVLEAGGIVQIFDGSDTHIFPRDIVNDTEALWVRWMSGDVDTHLLRGIEFGHGTLQKSGRKHTNYQLDKNFQKKSANVVGENGLVNGQWWPSRLCALRDGAHGAPEAGIHGQVGKGAYSVVVASGGYADKDYGEVIEYCGTESGTSTPTRSTALVEEAYLIHQYLRVLRAVNKKSQYAPIEGIRYDGLYEITGKEILDASKAMYRFTLKRVDGQDPIRYQGVEKRPSDQELAARMTIRKLLSGMD